MVCGFLGEDLSVFGIFSRESFLQLRRFCLHGQVSGHSQFVKGSGSKRSDEARAASLDMVDDERVNRSFREAFRGFGREVPA